LKEHILKARVLSSLAALALVIIVGSLAVRADTQEGTTSYWQVHAWIGQNVVSGVMIMTMTGNKVVAKFRDNTIHGDLVEGGNQINASYTGPRGSGWITLNLHNEGNGFGGEWGQKGKGADGKFVGSRITPSPAPAGTQ